MDFVIKAIEDENKNNPGKFKYYKTGENILNLNGFNIYIPGNEFAKTLVDSDLENILSQEDEIDAILLLGRKAAVSAYLLAQDCGVLFMSLPMIFNKALPGRKELSNLNKDNIIFIENVSEVYTVECVIKIGFSAYRIYLKNGQSEDVVVTNKYALTAEELENLVYNENPGVIKPKVVISNLYVGDISNYVRNIAKESDIQIFNQIKHYKAYLYNDTN